MFEVEGFFSAAFVQSCKGPWCNESDKEAEVSRCPFKFSNHMFLDLLL